MHDTSQRPCSFTPNQMPGMPKFNDLCPTTHHAPAWLQPLLTAPAAASSVCTCLNKGKHSLAYTSCKALDRQTQRPSSVVTASEPADVSKLVMSVSNVSMSEVLQLARNIFALLVQLMHAATLLTSVCASIFCTNLSCKRLNSCVEFRVSYELQSYTRPSKCASYNPMSVLVTMQACSSCGSNNSSGFLDDTGLDNGVILRARGEASPFPCFNRKHVGHGHGLYAAGQPGSRGVAKVGLSILHV